jgi:AcrR family transcriptional regulator
VTAWTFRGGALDSTCRLHVLTNLLVKKKGRPRGSGRGSDAAIFAAAAREFAARGYDAAGVDRIAAGARVNKAMIYYHYGSKLALYVEVLRDMFRAVAARARAIADRPGPAEDKLDAWIVAIVEEAAARPWLPPIMLREVASGGTHLDPETIGMLNAVFAAVRDVIIQGQREGVFRDADPLLTHLTIMPAVLIFFARQRIVAQRKAPAGIGARRQVEEFVVHMQASARGMLRKTP